MKEKRSQKQIEKDYQIIRKVAEETTAIYLKDLALELDMTESKIMTSLEKHPRAKVRIMKRIAENCAKAREKARREAREKAEREAREKAEREAREKAEREAREKAEREAREKAEREAREKAEREAREKAEREAREKAEREAREKAEREAREKAKRKVCEKAAVIDASIVGFTGLQEYLEQKAMLVITSITIRELENLARFHDTHGIAARHLLAMAAENPDKVQTVLIAEEEETPDDCIIRYAEENKDDVILLTSDKTMALKARMFGIETEYLKHGENSPSNKSKNTLLLASKEDGKLVINTFITPFRSTLVLSDGVEYKIGPYELKVGDDVMVATNKGEYLTFSHYKMTALQENDNCHLVYATRIYKVDKIEDLPKASYKSFMRDFKHRLQEYQNLMIN